MPYETTECTRGKYYNKVKDGKQCVHFEKRLSAMFKMQSKKDILKKYIELLKIENKTEKVKSQIELLDWIFKKEVQDEG